MLTAENSSYLMEICIEEVRAFGERVNTPFIMLKPRIFPDGNQWCALYGDNLQDGVAGFGNTPADAENDFNRNWSGQTLGRTAND